LISVGDEDARILITDGTESAVPQSKY
jgi:hypothetical protein